MGDVMSWFGGKKEKSTSKPVDTTPEELKRLRDPFVNTLTSLFSQGGRPAYGGPFVASLTDPERMGLGATADAAYNPNRGSYLNDVMTGKYLPGGENANPWFAKAVAEAQRPTLQGLEETLTRSLPGRFTMGGHLTNPKSSSAFDRAAAIATRGVADAVSGIATNMGNTQFQNERANQQQAVALQQNDVQTMIQNLQAQGLPRLIEDLGIERALQEFQSRMGSLLQALGIAAGSPIANQGDLKTATSTTQQGIIPGISGLISSVKGTPFLPTASI